MSTEIQISKKIAVLEEGALITPNVNQIDFVGNGVAASTIGNNVTVNIPGSTGSTTYYMNQSINQAPYKEFSSVATLAVEQVVPLTVLAGATSTIAEYQTPTGVPGTTQIPTGLWQFFLHFNAAVAGQNWIIRPTVYKRDLGGIETLLLTLDPVVVTNMPTVTTMYISDAVFPAATVLTSDRVVVKIAMENTTGVSQTVNFRTEGTQHYSVGLTTLNQVIPAGGVTAVTGTSPVVSSGGLTPAISMPQATASVNGYLASSDWAIFNAKQNAITLTTTGSSGASTLIGATLNIPNYAGGSSGIWGISNSVGVYTYYTTLTLAMAAAVSGQVIEMFADFTETGAVSITLKTGVNINGNGHTYTLNNSGTSNCIQDGAVAVSCTISNITFKRLGGTPSSINTLCMYITGASNIRCSSTILIGGPTYMRCLTINHGSAEIYGIYAQGYNPTITVTNGTLIDSTARAIDGAAITVEASGKLINCTGYGSNAGGINNSGTATNCTGYDGSVGGFTNNGTALNCTGSSPGSNGFTCGGGSSNVNCIGYSSAGVGFFSNGGVNIISCKGYSTANAGMAFVNGAAYDSMGFSTTSYGLWASNSGGSITDLRSCRAISLAAVAIFMNNTNPSCKIYNTEAYCKWDNVLGHGIVVAGQNAEIVQCTIEVTNASANAINAASARTTKYANNAFKGSTTPINANITQSIINTHDNQGNILV